MSLWNAVRPKSFLEVVNGAQKLEDTVQHVFGLGFDPTAMKDADHDAVWMLSSLETDCTFTNESTLAIVYRDVVDG